MSGDYLVDLERQGLYFYGGTVGGSFDETFTFAIPSRPEATFPLPVASAPGEPTGIFELSRLAAPLPTIVPSYNQIGFDSTHYLVGIVEAGADENHMIGWSIGATVDATGATVVDPSSAIRFPLQLVYDAGAFTMLNNEGFTIQFNNFPLAFDFFRIAARIDEQGDAPSSTSSNARGLWGARILWGVPACTRLLQPKHRPLGGRRWERALGLSGRDSTRPRRGWRG